MNMKPDLAERVSKLLHEMDVPIGGLMEAVRALPDSEKKQEQSNLLGELLRLQFECMEAIAIEHPETRKIGD